MSDKNIYQKNKSWGDANRLHCKYISQFTKTSLFLWKMIAVLLKLDDKYKPAKKTVQKQLSVTSMSAATGLWHLTGKLPGAFKKSHLRKCRGLFGILTVQTICVPSCFFASSNNDRGLSWDDKTKDYVDRNAGGQVESLHEVTQLGWYSRWKFAYLSSRTQKVISRKLK